MMMEKRSNFRNLLELSDHPDLDEVKEIPIDILDSYKNQLVINDKHKHYKGLFLADLAYKPVTDDVWYCLKDRYGHIGVGVKFKIMKSRVKSEFFKDEDLMIMNTKEINYECN